MVYGVGVYDMPRGWRTESDLNKRIYRCWYDMIRRCYDNKYQTKQPTYKNCYVCDRWLTFSNFLEDIHKITNYTEWIEDRNYQLDKDIKSNGINKCYCVENCTFATKSDNSIQANKTRNYTSIKEMDKTYCSTKVIQYDKGFNIINIYNSTREAERLTGISHKLISSCCQYRAIDCDKEEWLKTHNYNPNKTAGGFIWMYYKE